MQEKESIMIVRCRLKIPSLGITALHHLASLMMADSYPRDGIFNLQRTTIKDSYNLSSTGIFRSWSHYPRRHQRSVSRNWRKTSPDRSPYAKQDILFLLTYYKGTERQHAST